MNIDKRHIVTGFALSAIMLHTGMNVSFADTEYRTITGDSVNFRSGPSTSYSSIGRFNKGDKVGYISESGSWVKIKYNDKIGYVSGTYVSKSTQTTTTKYVNASRLNFRSGASTSSSIIGRIAKGTAVQVISKSNGWSKIQYNGQTGYVSSTYLVDKITDSDSSITTSASAVISYAKSLLGKPYVWGAQGPSSFDCSGYIYYVFKNAANVTIPRTSSEQSKYGTYISKSNLNTGDLVFFDTTGVNDGNVSHVGIYIGNNQFIHCSSSKAKVVISQLDSSYYTGAYVNARRVL